MAEEQNLILSLNRWRIISDSIAALHIGKLAVGFEVTIILKTGYEIVEVIDKEQTIKLGTLWIARMKEIYGVELTAFEGE